MKRQAVLFLAVLGLMIGLGTLSSQQQKPKKQDLLVLDWAGKSSLATPPLAILIEMGMKDEQPTKWNGRVIVKGAKVVHREGYRFRAGDQLGEPDAWGASSHRPLRLPKGQPAIAKMEGMASVGVVVHLADVQPDATLDIDYMSPKEGQVHSQKVKELLDGKHVLVEGGRLVVRRISTAMPVITAKTEDDFPAAAYGPDGTLWLAYISYTHKDESRRIETEPYKEPPANFKHLYNPEFGDQLFVKYYRDGKWSEPIAVTGPREDLVRCAIAADGKGTVLVAYSAKREGRYDVYARQVSPKLERESKVTGGVFSDEAGYLAPVMCTTQSSEILMACQTWYKDGRGGMLFRRGLSLQAGGTLFQSGGGGSGANWNVAIAAGPDRQWRIAGDSYRQDDFDVLLPYHGTPTASGTLEEGGGGDLNPVAQSSRFEARPSICYDPQGRLWIAYEEGPVLWGKDYGALDSNDGNPLYNERAVRVVCLQDGKLFKPATELPTSPYKAPVLPFEAPNTNQFERATRYAYPKIGIDGKGRVWVTYREKFGSRYSSHPGSYWLTFARRLDGDKWSEPIEIHHSDGLLDHRPVLLPHKSGGLLIVHNTDGRFTTPDTIDNQIYMSYVDLPGEPMEPKLVSHDSGKKDPALTKRAADEAAAVKRIRDYRVEAGGKKYQLLRGEFHRHTELSWDGGPDGSLEDMFRYGIDAAAFDWIGNGDHDSGAGREYSWWLIQKFTDAYHVKNAFTPMFTYERSVSYPHGHRNCMFAQRGVMTLPRLAAPEGKAVGGAHADDTKMLYRYLHELDGICAVHTSATGMGTDWRDNDPKVEPIVEIYQGDRMSYEMENAPRAGYDPKTSKLPANVAGWFPAGFINNAFAKGYRLGFQASSDHWSTHISYCIVLAERHDREAILDGVKRRHCYGATDDIIVDLRSGTHVMGDEFKTAAPPKLEVTVIGTKPLAKIDILKDSEVVQTIQPGKQEYRGAWTDPKPTAGVHYYYIRVLQTDDEIAWASPLWIEYTK